MQTKGNINYIIVKVDERDGTEKVYRFVYKEQDPPVDKNCCNRCFDDLPEHKNKSLYINGKILEYRAAAYYRDEWKPNEYLVTGANALIANICMTSHHYRRNYDVSILHLLDMCILYMMELLPGIQFKPFDRKIHVDVELMFVRFEGRKIRIPSGGGWKEMLEIFKRLIDQDGY